MKRTLLILVAGLVLSAPLLAQATGSIAGKVTAADGSALPGATVQASSDVLPRPRVTVTDKNGDFTLPLLPPGDYSVAFSMEGMDTITQNVTVLLQQTAELNATMGRAEFKAAISVVSETPLLSTSSTQISNAIPDKVLKQVPVGQQYQDVVKLIPAVQYTQDATRGPSAGGSGQDNVYQFDGVNVGLPLFGVLSAEPSSYDIDQVAVVRGGAKAKDFNRSGGFLINTVSKSGTNAYHGEVSYQLQSSGMTSNQTQESAAQFDENKDWSVLNIGGPIVSDRLFFYASYYRPTVTRDNRANLYGSVPNLDDTRNEYYGKLTYTPTDSFLLDVSYRDSDHTVHGSSVGGIADAGSTSEGSDSTLKIGILDGSWVINNESFLSFRYSHYKSDNSSRPDNMFGFPIRDDGSVMLDVNNLDKQGLFLVPTPLAGQADYNAFIASLIQKYGYIDGGVAMGGGSVGGGSTINNQDFTHTNYQLGYDQSFGETWTHDVHVGYQWYKDEEDLSRLSNGWGVIDVVQTGPDDVCHGEPVCYRARFWQQSLQGGGGTVVPIIHSELESHNIELNDTIRWNDWSFNVGVMLSHDIYYGQGLRKGGSNPSGFELAPGHKYEMYTIPFDKMIQPRLGAVWNYNGEDTVYVSYASYTPAASSLPRAASWDRNLEREIFAYFDPNGGLISVDPIRSSSGKFFQKDMKPRTIDEYMIGTSQRLSSKWSARAYARYRHGYNFWEDTNNTAREAFDPPAGIPREPYISNLDELETGIGGSSYVIAALNNAFTKYYEATIETEWRGDKAYFSGSYTWSHYYGNFDQDNTTTSNDAAIFIGSSFIADGAGRQLWNFRYGNLRGDRPSLLKLYGYYALDWDATVGAYAVYQSGQPWEAWNVLIYRAYTGSSSDTSRYAEPAGSHRTPAHYQLDLNYTQNFKFGDRYNLQLVADLYNVFNKQTGYDVQNKVNSAGFGTYRRFYSPRKLQLSARFQF